MRGCYRLSMHGRLKHRGTEITEDKTRRFADQIVFVASPESGQGGYFVITGQTSNHSRRWSSIHFDDSLGPHDFVW